MVPGLLLSLHTVLRFILLPGLGAGSVLGPGGKTSCEEAPVSGDPSGAGRQSTKCEGK